MTKQEMKELNDFENGYFERVEKERSKYYCADKDYTIAQLKEFNKTRNLLSTKHWRILFELNEHIDPDIYYAIDREKEKYKTMSRQNMIDIRTGKMDNARADV